MSYTASPSTAGGGNWLTISPANGQATPGKPSMEALSLEREEPHLVITITERDSA